jgi:hypothetical protein
MHHHAYTKLLDLCSDRIGRRILHKLSKEYINYLMKLMSLIKTGGVGLCLFYFSVFMIVIKNQMPGKSWIYFGTELRVKMLIFLILCLDLESIIQNKTML